MTEHKDGGPGALRAILVAAILGALVWGLLIYAVAAAL
jgi:hypothetical protein